MSPTPRVVVVTRPTDFEELMARHGTREQARFFLEQRDQRIEPVELRHRAHEHALTRVSQAIPVRWRRSRIARADLPRFVWEPDDVVVTVGQDGLVANVAKYLDGQHVIGVAPGAPGPLARHAIDALEPVLRRTVERRACVEERTMVVAELDDGQRLLALNEIFVGHRSHQSARYRIALAGSGERHSSSGVIVATGTGATGWASSIARERGCPEALPAATDTSLAFFVREAWLRETWPGGADRGGAGLGEAGRPTAARIRATHGILARADERLEITSEMSDGGVVFGDGIEDDRLPFGWGLRVRVGIARERLRLVVSA